MPLLKPGWLVRKQMVTAVLWGRRTYTENWVASLALSDASFLEDRDNNSARLGIKSEGVLESSWHRGGETTTVIRTRESWHIPSAKPQPRLFPEMGSISSGPC